jgi:hypothetical protein
MTRSGMATSGSFPYRINSSFTTLRDTFSFIVSFYHKSVGQVTDDQEIVDS